MHLYPLLPLVFRWRIVWLLRGQSQVALLIYLLLERLVSIHWWRPTLVQKISGSLGRAAGRSLQVVVFSHLVGQPRLP